MASRKEYEMLFQLNAQLGGSYSKTFKAAQDELAAMQKEIQSLSKTQSDITAYQKQQTAVENTRKRLELLQQQYDNIQKEIQQTGEFSADLQNKLLAKQQQIDKTTSSLNRQTERLDEMGDALKEAGVDMDDLGQSSARLTNRIDALKKEQEEVAEGAQTFGNKASQAFGAVHEAIVAAGIATALKEVYEYFADCAQASMDFESAMTGVAKTTDLTDDELSAMSDAIKEMSTEIPATTEELAASKISSTSSFEVDRGLLYLALVGADTRGFLHARTKRRAVACFMKRTAISGSSFFSAELSSRALVTGFQVTFQSLPERMSTPWASIRLLMLSWTASISAASSSAIRRSSRNSFIFALISVALIVWAPFQLVW